MTQRSRAGFTLIELLVVVAIIAIVATIAAGAYMNALHRARQKRTASDIRTIATAWESRAADGLGYSVAGYTFPSAAVTYPELIGALTPTYARSLPEADGWGRPFEFAAGLNQYGIRSPGRDGVYEGTTYVQAETDSPDCDIVYGNGSFVRYPGTVQSE